MLLSVVETLKQFRCSFTGIVLSKKSKISLTFVLLIY